MQQPPQLLLNKDGQALLGLLQQQAVNVDAGVLGWLVVQQREGQRHCVLCSVLPPDTGAETTVAFGQNEVLLAVTGRR